MTTTWNPELVELAERENEGIVVSLLWRRADDRLTVVVCDRRTDDTFVLAVDPERALDAFYHPYAWAARTGTAYLAPARAAA